MSTTVNAVQSERIPHWLLRSVLTSALIPPFVNELSVEAHLNKLCRKLWSKKWGTMRHQDQDCFVVELSDLHPHELVMITLFAAHINADFTFTKDSWRGSEHAVRLMLSPRVCERS